MKAYKFFIAIVFTVLITSCTLDKTDFESELSREVTEYNTFKEVGVFHSASYKISIEVLGGALYQGYNEIRIKVLNEQSNSILDDEQVTLLPVFTDADNSTSSGPHQYKLTYNAKEQYYAGYVVFPNISNANTSWNLHIGFKDKNSLYQINPLVIVQQQTNKNLNMTSFVGNDGNMYYIALVAPQKPKVAENKLVAGIYKYMPSGVSDDSLPNPDQFSYTEVQNYTLMLDPRMPEPSMGNHSSPNNVDLTQQANGLYSGVVNYTMTGKWTLNFILKDATGEIIKGTQIPTDFTPGQEGVKSDLHIDILF